MSLRLRGRRLNGRWVLALALLLTVLLGGGAYLAGTASQGSSQTMVVQPDSKPAPHAANQPPAAASQPTLDWPPSPQNSAAAAAKAVLAPHGKVEICGRGFVDLRDATPEALEAAWAKVQPERRAQVLRTLAQGSHAEQAAGLVSRFFWRGADQSALGELLTLAKRSNDPAVHAAANGLCGMVGAVMLCTHLERQRWAELAPDSAWPWLYRAQQAAANGQPQLQTQALLEAAKRLLKPAPEDMFNDLYRHPAWASWPEDERVQLNLDWVALGSGVGLSLEGLGSASKACLPGPGLELPGRRQACDALAHHLVNNSGQLTAMYLGAGIGERLGWPRAKVQAARVPMDAAPRFLMAPLADLLNRDHSCAAQARRHAWLRERAELGELAQLNAMAARSGRTLGQWAEASRQARASAAASAASASASK